MTHIVFKTMNGTRIPDEVHELWKKDYKEAPMCNASIPIVQRAMMLTKDEPSHEHQIPPP